MTSVFRAFTVCSASKPRYQSFSFYKIPRFLTFCPWHMTESNIRARINCSNQLVPSPSRSFCRSQAWSSYDQYMLALESEFGCCSLSLTGMWICLLVWWLIVILLMGYIESFLSFTHLFPPCRNTGLTVYAQCCIMLLWGRHLGGTAYVSCKMCLFHSPFLCLVLERSQPTQVGTDTQMLTSSHVWQKEKVIHWDTANWNQSLKRK